jgi:carboxyl-terminal processing protease
MELFLMSRWNLAWLLGLPALIILGLTVVFAAPRPQKNRDQDYEMVQLMVDVLAEVDQKFVRELTPEQRRKLVEDMINGGLERLDPYSTYLNPDEYGLFMKQSEGAFGGIGIQVGIDRATGLLQVNSPMVGTPAYDAGILAGDLILKVDGKPCDSMRQDEVIRMIQGDPGTPVTLTVVHEGTKEPIEVTMKRAKIEYPSILGDVRQPDDPAKWDFFIDKANRIAYIRLIAFNDHSAKDLRKEIEKLQGEGLRGLVLDLRDNGGGLLTSAVEISDLFIKKGEIVSVRDRKGRGKSYEAKGNHTVMEPPAAHPIALLINRNTASASEIVAAALQDHHRAVIVGERSFGKGSVQNIIILPDHNPQDGLKLTTASYWRPSGANIHRHPDAKEADDWGVRPDPNFEIKLDDKERLLYRRWRQQRDVVYGKPGSPAPAKPKEEKDAQPFTDRALEKALEYVRAELQKS